MPRQARESSGTGIYHVMMRGINHQNIFEEQEDYYQFLKGKIRKERFFLLLRQYQEEMLDAYLQDTEDFPSMLHYCNVLYETLPMILNSSHLRGEKWSSKLAAIAVVAAGYGGDMDEELANELLDDMDFDKYGKVKCRKIEGMLPKLMKMVEGEMRSMR